MVESIIYTLVFVRSALVFLFMVRTFPLSISCMDFSSKMVEKNEICWPTLTRNQTTWI